MRKKRWNVFVIAVGMLLAGSMAAPRAQQSTGMGSRPPQIPDPLAPMGQKETAEQREKIAKSVQEDRQKKLVSDTEKLLALATALHADVSKTDKNILSLDVIRRAEEIEKLAHSVKERMKG